MKETLLDRIQVARNRGQFNQPDAIGLCGNPGRGPFIVFYLRIEVECVSAARFESEGCGPTIASGSVLTELIIGRTIEECRAITAEQIEQELGGLPPHKKHCPRLAITALHAALDNWAESQVAKNDRQQ